MKLNPFLRTLGAAVLTLVLTGCVGIYNNTDRFLNEPEAGTSEADVLKKLGAPSFATTSGDTKVLTYKVRDTKYIVLIGLYDGYDLLITFEDGEVVDTHKVELPRAFSLFTPVPWLVTE